MNLKINVKSTSKKKNSIKQEIIDVDKMPTSVSELLEITVEHLVKQYENRQESQDVLKLLTKDDIENKKESGKISFGINYGEKKPNLNKCIENAKQSFEDGIVVIFIDYEEQKSLNDKINITSNSIITFIRMTMLTGRLW